MANDCTYDVKIARELLARLWPYEHSPARDTLIAIIATAVKKGRDDRDAP